jgi:hypothetical protein
MPMSMTVGPVTMGGNTRRITRGGTNEMRISSSEHTAAVPSTAPYASGQGSGVPSSADGQNPLAYIWAKAPEATVMMANEMPTTEMRPVPR